MRKPISSLGTDEAAERFVDQADLMQHDLSGFLATRFEFEVKAARLSLRLPETLLQVIKAQAKARGIPYTRFAREILEKAVSSCP